MNTTHFIFYVTGPETIDGIDSHEWTALILESAHRSGLRGAVNELLKELSSVQTLDEPVKIDIAKPVHSSTAKMKSAQITNYNEARPGKFENYSVKYFDDCHFDIFGSEETED